VAEPFVERLEEVEVDAAGLVGRREAADDPGRAVAHGGRLAASSAARASASALRGESAPQCPSPRAPGGRQHEQAEAGARREAIPDLVLHSPGQPPSHLRPPPTAWSRKCPGSATSCQNPPPPPHHHQLAGSRNRSGRHATAPPASAQDLPSDQESGRRRASDRNGGSTPGRGERGRGRPRSRSSRGVLVRFETGWVGDGRNGKDEEGAGNGIVGSCVSDRGRKWSGAPSAVEWRRRDSRGGVGAFGFPPPPSVRHAARQSLVGREACLLGRLRFARWSLAASPVLVLAYLACSRLFRLPLSSPLLDVPPSVFFVFFLFLKLGRSL
jgi:hypothetical protein